MLIFEYSTEISNSSSWKQNMQGQIHCCLTLAQFQNSDILTTVRNELGQQVDPFSNIDAYIFDCTFKT